MASLPYMQLYVAEYLADTMHLTTEEHGAYLLLLFSYWQTGKPLRADRLASITKISNERWTNVERTLKEFFHVSGGVWIHKRVEVDLEKAGGKSRKNSEAGKKSALARTLAKQALAESESTNVATNDATNAERTYQRNGNHTRSRDTDTDKDIDQHQDQKHLVRFPLTEAFEAFWRLYPRKVSKASARKKFETKCRDQKTFELIIASVAKHIEHAWNLSEMNFIPHASAWLNQERWNDEVSHVRPKQNSGTSRPRSLSLSQRVRIANGIALESPGSHQSPPGDEWEGEFDRIAPDGRIMGSDD